MKLVVSGAKLKCGQGTAPGTLTVLPHGAETEGGLLTATVLDNAPAVNVASFGMCQTQANPEVAAATAAAMGVLTPMPCLPVIPAPWSPGSQLVTIAEQKALTDDSTCSCAWTGTIQITDAGSTVETQ
jgi:hypothetical protein